MFSEMTGLVSCDWTRIREAERLDIRRRIPLRVDFSHDCRVSANADIYVFDRERAAIFRVDLSSGDSLRLQGDDGVLCAVSAMREGGYVTLAETDERFLLRWCDREGRVTREKEVPSNLRDPVAISSGPDGAIWVADRQEHALFRVADAGIEVWRGRASYRETMRLASARIEDQLPLLLRQGLLEYPSWLAGCHRAMVLVDRDKMLLRLRDRLYVCEQPSPFYFGHPALDGLTSYLLGEQGELLTISPLDLEVRSSLRVPEDALALTVLPSRELAILREREICVLEPPQGILVTESDITLAAQVRSGIRILGNDTSVRAIPGGGSSPLELTRNGFSRSMAGSTGISAWVDPVGEAGDRIYVCLRAEKRVAIFDKDLMWIGDLSWKMVDPIDIAVIPAFASAGNSGLGASSHLLVIADCAGNRLILMTPSGNPLAVLESDGAGTGLPEIRHHPLRIHVRDSSLCVHLSGGEVIALDPQLFGWTQPNAGLLEELRTPPPTSTPLIGVDPSDQR